MLAVEAAAMEAVAVNLLSAEESAASLPVSPAPASSAAIEASSPLDCTRPSASAVVCRSEDALSWWEGALPPPLPAGARGAGRGTSGGSSRPCSRLLLLSVVDIGRAWAVFCLEARRRFSNTARAMRRAAPAATTAETTPATTGVESEVDPCSGAKVTGLVLDMVPKDGAGVGTNTAVAVDERAGEETGGQGVNKGTSHGMGFGGRCGTSGEPINLSKYRAVGVCTKAMEMPVQPRMSRIQS